MTLVRIGLHWKTPEVGKGMVEDWPPRRGSPEGEVSEGDDTRISLSFIPYTLSLVWKDGASSQGSFNARSEN